MLLIASLISFVFSLIMAFMSNIYAMIVIRALNGLGFGMIAAITPLYSSELASDKRRGLLVGLFQGFTATGIVVGYVLNIIFCKVNDGWHYELGINSLFPLLIAVGSILMPESPIWENNKKEEKAKLDALASSGASAVPKLSVGQVAKHYLKVFKKHPRGIIVAIFFALSYQFTGGNILMYYAPSLLSQAGVQTRILSLGLTIVIGAWNAICCLAPLVIVDRFGRRALLIIGSAIQVVGMLLVAISYTVKTLGEYSFALALPGILVFLTGIEIGLAPLFFVIINEIFPPSITAMASSISQCLMWLGNIVILLIFQPIANGMTMGGFFFLLMGICVLQLLFCIFVLRETKGKRISDDDDDDLEAGSELRKKSVKQQADNQGVTENGKIEMGRRSDVPVVEMVATNEKEQNELVGQSQRVNESEDGNSVRRMGNMEDVVQVKRVEGVIEENESEQISVKEKKEL